MHIEAANTTLAVDESRLELSIIDGETYHCKDSLYNERPWISKIMGRRRTCQLEDQSSGQVIT